MKDYGVQVYARGVVIHGDGRRRVWDEHGVRPVLPGGVTRGDRGLVRAMSRASYRRLEFIACNAAASLRTLITLTYHARAQAWENDEGRNLRIVRRSKRDLNRFLSCLRRELGENLWVQEFQERGVIHYHLLCEGSPSHGRVTAVWVRATNEQDDDAALQYAVRVEAAQGEESVRSYLGRYLGKGRQKSLPAGVGAAGRWWGRSKGLGLALKRELVVQGFDERMPRDAAARAQRSFRRWLSHRLKYRVHGGVFLDCAVTPIS
jgi:hypothetical protein